MLRALLDAVRRFFSRLAARRLLAQRLPRGIREQRLRLPQPPSPPAGELWTVGRRPRRLFRLAILPRPPGIAVLDPRKFRLDPRTHAPPGEADASAVRDPSFRWLSAAFRRRYVDLPWMARDRVRFLGPTSAEWFALWWEQSIRDGTGPREPLHWQQPDEVEWALEECKEQMLIRRDVPKDEHGPAPSEMGAAEIGHPVAAWEPAKVAEMVPPKQWVERADPRSIAPLPSPGRARREAYLRWRTLLDALGD